MKLSRRYPQIVELDVSTLAVEWIEIETEDVLGGVRQVSTLAVEWIEICLYA